MIRMNRTTRKDILAHMGKDWNEIYYGIRALGEIATFKEKLLFLDYCKKSTTVKGEPGKGDFGRRLIREMLNMLF